MAEAREATPQLNARKVPYKQKKDKFLLTQQRNQDNAVCRRGGKGALVVDEDMDALDDASVRLGNDGGGCVELLFV
jgi:hypothetical protein